MASKKLSEEQFQEIKDQVKAELIAEAEEAARQAAAKSGIDFEGGKSDEEDTVAFFEEIGNRSKKVSLERQEEKHNGKFYYLGTVESEGLTLDWVKDEFGGGTFRARLLDEKGKFIRAKNFSIDPRYKARVPLNESSSSQIIHTSSTDGMGEIKLLIEKQNALIERIFSRPPVDPLDSLDKMTSIISKLMPQRETASIQSPLNADTLFSIFQKGIDLGMGMNSDSYMPVIKEMGMPLLEIVKNITKNGTAIQEKIKAAIPSTVPIPSQGAMPPPSPPTPPPVSAPAQVPGLEDIIKAYLPQLCQLAKFGKDPSLYADLTLDQMPGEHFDSFANLLSDPQLIEKLATVNPEVKNHEQWFKDYIQATKDGITEGETTAPATGDAEEDVSE